MVDPGMYAVILKWGLGSLTQLVGERHKGEVSILLEAMRVKNDLVVKRYEYSWDASSKLVEILDSVEDGIDEAKKAAGENLDDDAPSAERLKRFKLVLQSEVHPKLHRRLRGIRGSFEATNDLFSAYSIEFSRFLQFSNYSKMLDQTNESKQADAARLYRQMWVMYSDIMNTLIRITSSDLRFWLTDISYFEQAEAIAAQDRTMIEEHLKTKNQETWRLFIEKPASVEEFWKSVEAA